MTLGFLVRSTDNSLGMGKIVAVAHPYATVEYFVSFGQRISQTLPFSSLRRIKLEHQTRCYFYCEDTETWQMGRIYAWDEEKQQYQVDLPNCKTIYADESQIYVRCNRPIEDPIDILAMKGQETPYFYHKRADFLKTVIEQRAISRGMTGLLSANIKLFPHQVEVIRRVLEDPIQRYLLADEVGLGKTIESGTILRQFLLDNPNQKALILVPPSLYTQWEQELEDKFYIKSSELKVNSESKNQGRDGQWSNFSGRVRLISTDERERFQNLTDNYHFLIIDEAHHIAAMAMSEDLEKRRYFETCRKLAHQAEKLLLLSATPVLNHEQDFLAMLHLLDPVTYQLNDLDGFRERIQKRQEIGRVLLSFKEGIHPFVLKKSINTLKTLFSEDQPLLTLIEELQIHIENQDNERINQQILAIRTHISDTYRLHRRMLRNRRVTVEDVIFNRNAVPKLEHDLDERVYELHDLLDEWRIVAPDDVNYQRIFTLLFRASNTWLGVLKQVVDARLKSSLNASSTDVNSLNSVQNTSSSLTSALSPIERRNRESVNYSDLNEHKKISNVPSLHIDLIEDIGESNYKLLTETPLFDEEGNILTSILKILETPSEDGDRLELLKIIILYHLADILNLQSFKSNLDKLQQRVQQRIQRPFTDDQFPKLVIFTTFTPTCIAIVNHLSKVFGQKAVVSHKRGSSKETIDANLDQFKNNPHCFILVADSSGEEGINLQFVDGVIHFDLPFSPNQLEQRLGRVDRIGGKFQVKSWLLAGIDGSSSFSDGWYQLLNEGFNIFNQSIASLQFYVETRISEFERIMFKDGAMGLREKISTIQEEIEQENIKISEQYALDEIDARSEVARDYFQELEDYDAQHKMIEKAVERWLCKGLDFQRIYDNSLYCVRSYKPTMKTLIPITDLKNYFAPYLRDKGVYNRRLANQYSEVHLYRIGEELIDALTHYLNWDDRGKGFAIWRKDPNWDESEGQEWLGFRFDYIIELDWLKINEVLTAFHPFKFNTNSLQRQGDALFPPRVESVFLDQYFEPVEDKKLLDILSLPYSKKGEGYKDSNLAKNKLSMLDEFIDPSQWQNFCYEARKQSEILLRQSSSFREICQKQTAIAQKKLLTRLSQLKSRYSRFPQPSLGDELQLEMALMEAFLTGIGQPKCHLDAVGFIIVSGRSPVQSSTKGDEFL